MQGLTLFYQEGCPHCKLAQQSLAELQEENPAYKQIPIERIEESQHPEIAEKWDYYYVPTFFMGKEKLMEGHMEKADVKQVLDRALAG